MNSPANPDLVFNRLLIALKARAALIVLILAVSFAAFYQILQPPNFGAFSNMSAYFISGLAVLLAIVISFNSFTLKNETGSMSSEVKRVEEELEKMDDLLKPLKAKAADSAFDSATRYATVAVHQMVQVALGMAEELIAGNRLPKDSKAGSICLDFIAKSKYYISLFRQTHNIYSLAIIPTTDFIIRMQFKTAAPADQDSAAEEWYEALKRLHVLRNIASTVFVRSSVAHLSYEILFSTIPVIFLMAATSFAFSHEGYDPAFVRAVFAGSLSAATLPFVLLAIRTIPMVHLAQNNSGLPFSHR